MSPYPTLLIKLKALLRQRFGRMEDESVRSWQHLLAYSEPVDSLRRREARTVRIHVRHVTAQHRHGFRWVAHALEPVHLCERRDIRDITHEGIRRVGR